MLSEKEIQLMAELQLPQEYAQAVEDIISPLARRVAQHRQKNGRPVVVGINGAQGSGKSTLAAFLKLKLEEHHGLPTALMSLDDLYLSKHQRQRLAQTVHPLLKTRGVPGTHDVSLGVETICQLTTASASAKTLIPRFDKTTDDPCPKEQWVSFQGKAEVVILEGWCVSARPQHQTALQHPVNVLERDEDNEGVWRNYVNQQLITDYPALFNLIDLKVLLKVPCFERVLAWRTLQESKLRQQAQVTAPVLFEDSPLMDGAELQRFVMHFERLTRFMLVDLPGRVDTVIEVDDDHRLVGL